MSVFGKVPALETLGEDWTDRRGLGSLRKKAGEMDLSRRRRREEEEEEKKEGD